MEEHTTYPSIVAIETIPVPLSTQSPPVAAAPGFGLHAGVQLAMKLALLALAVWAVRHWW